MAQGKVAMLFLALWGGGLAQTLVEVAAVASSLDPAVRLPQGSYKARSPEPIPSARALVSQHGVPKLGL